MGRQRHREPRELLLMFASCATARVKVLAMPSWSKGYDERVAGVALEPLGVSDAFHRVVGGMALGPLAWHAGTENQLR